MCHIYPSMGIPILLYGKIDTGHTCHISHNSPKQSWLWSPFVIIKIPILPTYRVAEWIIFTNHFISVAHTGHVLTSQADINFSWVLPGWVSIFFIWQTSGCKPQDCRIQFQRINTDATICVPLLPTAPFPKPVVLICGQPEPLPLPGSLQHPPHKEGGREHPSLVPKLLFTIYDHFQAWTCNKH